MYEKLRQAVDGVGIVDNHGHPGLVPILDEPGRRILLSSETRWQEDFCRN